MTVSGGALRSHRTALTHAVTTHPTPITPHHVINAIATPIGPSPFQPVEQRREGDPGGQRDDEVCGAPDDQRPGDNAACHAAAR